MRAIVFDFFGTLTDPAAETARRTSFTATAAALGVPAAAFWTAMSTSFPERATGVHGDTRATLREMARRCGVTPADDQLLAAVRVQHAGAEQVRRPRPGALQLLDDLRRAGFRLAVLSDCSSELVEAWPRTPYATRVDATVFSWQERHRKPDPRLYATAAARLGVPAELCWFVGDGGSREHQGAHTAGMRPVLVTNAAHPHAAALRDDPDTWRPPYAIDDLTALPTVVTAANVPT
ncbi:HAD family hydrolase [Paractinoplanes atraurantiacus]|uniref:Putative hydrolase of the HAD superfamily n=1 Tax=Paractinoplanes atraurantiacus TaxID=1036182 RepID=A0A285IAJ5_9ACTN|nr:HAD family hydrolase [Actinoplanes atraurantiacus]SNY45014.1 putative hydrolase of the HAD superfamily [Actinoplanes atraurantiacus]